MFWFKKTLVLREPLIAKRFARDFAIGPLHGACQDPTRADFVKLLDPVRDHFSQGRFPLDRRQDLPRQQSSEFVGALVRQCIDVGDQRNASGLQMGVLNGFGQRCDSRGHDVGMKRPGHAQANEFGPRSRSVLFAAIERTGVPRNGDVARAQQIRDLQDFARVPGGIAQRIDLVPLETENACHAARDGGRGRLHGAATGSDEADAIFEPERACCVKGAVFTEAETGDERNLILDLRMLLEKVSQGGDGMNEQRRLAVDRATQLGFRTFAAEFA